MKMQTFGAAALLVVFATADWAAAHCQVPCGIYGDQRRFEEMLEDTETITKCIDQVNELAGTHEATGLNQLVRWVTTKEDHATNIQRIMGDYFLAQRVKSDSENYVEQLKAAHGVIVAAMKCKQAADPATADALKKAIQDFYRAYTGKEPQVSEVELQDAGLVTTTGHFHEIADSAGAGHSHLDNAQAQPADKR